MKKKIEGTGKWLIKRWGVVSKEMKKDIERVEQEAERRGYERGLKEMQQEFSEYGVPDGVRYTHPLFYINGIIEDKLKLLEEENGKQNAR